MWRDRDRLITLAWSALALGCAGFALYALFRRYEPANPSLLWLLLITPLLVLFMLWRGPRTNAQIPLPTYSVLANAPFDLLSYLRPLPQALALGGSALLIMALSRPQSRDNWQDVQREGIDIMIALDVSASMLAKDLRPDRLAASKKVAQEFIDGRPNDRIGLVVYEGEAFTQCPLTTDHRVLKELFSGARSGLITGGTAVGMGLATALNRLRDSEAKSKVVILLTDGVSNAGMVQPLDAAQIAEQLGVRVYTIGVGSRGKALAPVSQYANGQYRYDLVDVEIDEATLTQVAELTGGQYFRAVDEGKLRDIYAEIDRMERTRIKVTEHSQRNDEYGPFLLLGVGLLMGGFLLDRTLLRTLA
jgi:Ca-activated chloride channel family protein